MAPERRAHLLLAVGAVLGIGLASYGIARPSFSAEALPPDAVATVNGVPIRRADFDRVLQSVKRERRTARVEPDDREHVLRKLIDEELLVQRAIELGLPRRDGRARSVLTRAVIDSIAPESTGAVTPDVLRAHYDQNQNYFRTPSSIRVEHVYIRDDSDSGGDAKDRARRLRGEWLEGQKPAGDASPVPLPRGLVSAAKLTDYLGPTVARAAFDLTGDAISEPIRSGRGFHLLRVTERSGGMVAPFEKVREQVAADYRRRAAERALRAYLERLRDEATISRAPPAP